MNESTKYEENKAYNIPTYVFLVDTYTKSNWTDQSITIECNLFDSFLIASYNCKLTGNLMNIS